MRVRNNNYDEQIKSYEEQISRQQQFIQDQQSALLTEQRCRQAIRSELNELEEKYALLLRDHISMMEKFRNHLSVVEKYMSIMSETRNESEGER